jgi:hypothetical protein
LKGDSVNLPELFKTGLTGVNATTMLTGMGVTGVVTTAYFSGRASFKAAQLIERETQRRIATAMGPSGEEPEMTTQDKVKLVWPLYVPAVGVGASTITAIVMSNHTASKKIAALTVASGISERALSEYKAKVLEKLGENKEMAIRDEIAQDRVSKNPPSNNTQVIMAGDSQVLCFDMMTGRYFMSTMETIKQAENKINYELVNHMYASLSKFYDEVGLAPTPYSDTVGWNVNERMEVVISTVLSPDNRPCLAVDFSAPPIAEYARLW